MLRHAGIPRGSPPGQVRSLLLPFLLCAPLVLRTKYPLTSWSVSVLAEIWPSRIVPAGSISGGGYLAPLIVYALCLYAVAVRCKTWVVISAGAVTVLGAVLLDGDNFAAVLFVAAIPVAEPARGPVARLLRAIWAPFGSMGGLPLATLILSLYGLGASIYLTIAHYDTHVSLICSNKGLINCEEVTTSPESIVFGIFPVAVLGLAFYVFMVAINSPWAWRLSWPAVRWHRFETATVSA